MKKGVDTCNEFPQEKWCNSMVSAISSVTMWFYANNLKRPTRCTLGPFTNDSWITLNMRWEIRPSRRRLRFCGRNIKCEWLWMEILLTFGACEGMARIAVCLITCLQLLSTARMPFTTHTLTLQSNTAARSDRCIPFAFILLLGFFFFWISKSCQYSWDCHRGIEKLCVGESTAVHVKLVEQTKQRAGEYQAGRLVKGQHHKRKAHIKP